MLVLHGSLNVLVTHRLHDGGKITQACRYGDNDDHPGQHGYAGCQKASQSAALLDRYALWLALNVPSLRLGM
jgi:hypothetical protein